MPVIFPFGEGKTERIIFTFLKDNRFQNVSFKQFISVGGKDKFKKIILDTVQGDLFAGRDEIRILVFRDLDNGEKVDDVVKSFQEIVYSLLGPRKLNAEPTSLRENVLYKWEVSAQSDLDFAGLRFILHIANHEGLDLPFSLLNQTSDGYILKVALDKRVLSRFARETKVGTSPNILFELITNKIPDVMREKNISFNEDKDYLSAYLTATRFWVVKRTEEESRLIDIILKRAWKHSQDYFIQVFESWCIAIQEAIR